MITFIIWRYRKDLHTAQVVEIVKTQSEWKGTIAWLGGMVTQDPHTSSARRGFKREPQEDPVAGQVWD